MFKSQEADSHALYFLAPSQDLTFCQIEIKLLKYLDVSVEFSYHNFVQVADNFKYNFGNNFCKHFGNIFRQQ